MRVRVLAPNHPPTSHNAQSPSTHPPLSHIVYVIFHRLNRGGKQHLQGRQRTRGSALATQPMQR